jgi:hypothetical protein
VAWLALSLLPWLASWIVPDFSTAWFALALFFWPAHAIATRFGVAIDSLWHSLFTLAYSLALALALDALIRRAASRLRRRRIPSLALAPAPANAISEEFWASPGAYWWRPPRSGSFYTTRDFPWSDRGPDGDHYCLLHVPDRGEFWLLLKANF